MFSHSRFFFPHFSCSSLFTLFSISSLFVSSLLFSAVLLFSHLLNISTRTQWTELVKEIDTKLDCLEKAQQALKSSAHLKTVLQVVLALGNFLNSSSKKGGAYGFKLDTLNKLKQTRSSDNKSTLMKFLVYVTLIALQPHFMACLSLLLAYLTPLIACLSPSTA
jgi:Rad3-related DNA helicase